MTSRELAHVGLNLRDGDPLTREQAGSAVFGFWVFLMSDAVLFALLFATYAAMLPGTAGGPGPAEAFKLRSAFIETLLLLSSSFTFGMASLAMKYDHARRALVLWLAVTLMLGLGFLAMELGDFALMFSQGAVPSRSGFLSAFFLLLATHGLHVLAGGIWIVVMIAQLGVYGADARVRTNILRLGLFWHFLDIIWVAIFSVVYLQGKIP